MCGWRRGAISLTRRYRRLMDGDTIEDRDAGADGLPATIKSADIRRMLTLPPQTAQAQWCKRFG